MAHQSVQGFRWLLFVKGWSSFVYVIHILLQNCSHHKRDAGEGQIIKGHIPVIEDCLCRKTHIEGHVELWESEKHIFVEKVEDHLANSDIIPSAMHQQHSPKHPKLW